jgi:MFS family permease
VAVNLGRYIDVLRTPGVARLVLFALIGRLPFGTLPLSMVLLMRHEHYPYGQIGAVIATEALAVGVTAVFIGRLVDRVGQQRVLITTGAITALAICAQAFAMASGASVALLVAIGIVQGASVPPVSPSMRALWAELIHEDRVETAYAFDSVALELAFIVGPLIAAGLATAWTPLAGMLLSAGFYLSAATGFALAPASRAWRPADSVERTRAGALRSPGIRTLVTAAAFAAVAFGALEVGLTAFAESEGSRTAVGPLITVWSIGSLAGGLVYGARTWSSPAPRRFLILSGLLGLGAVPLPFAGSLVAMGAFLFGTGLALAPMGATAYALLGSLAPAGTATEAYSWHIVANVVGSSVGAFLAGVLIEHASVEWALATASIACGLGLLVALSGRRTLSPAAPAVPTPELRQ